MSIDIREEPISRLEDLAAVPISYQVDRMLRVSLVDDGLGGIGLIEVAVDEPWTKDYDAIEGQGPQSWARRFDVSNWGLILARDSEDPVGGAVVAFDAHGVDMLDGRQDLAVLWDLRVRSELRSAGTGSRLFRAAEEWARGRGCRFLKVETQNTNLPACRFYQRMGCKLGTINRFAYADHPDEVQLIWFKTL